MPAAVLLMACLVVPDLRDFLTGRFYQPKEEMNMNRDETVKRMKKQLDDWNTQIDDWEKRMNDAQANMKSRYEEQLDTLRHQREEGMSKLKEIQESSEAAWADMSKGFEEAWQHLAEGFDKAWSEFRGKEQEQDESK
jgi:chromosome segregation ATPase